VDRASARLEGSLSLSIDLPVLELAPPGGESGGERAWVRGRERVSLNVKADSVEPDAAWDDRAHPAPGPKLIAGRLASAADEIVLDAMTAQRLSIARAREKDPRDGFVPPLLRKAYEAHAAVLDVPERLAQTGEAGRIVAEQINKSQRVRLGDRVTVVRQREIMGRGLPGVFSALDEKHDLRVVGISQLAPMDGRPRCYLTLGALQDLTNARGQVSEILLAVRPPMTPEGLVERRQPELSPRVLVQTTAKVTSGLHESVASGQLGFILAVVIVSLSAAFIILTGMTTNLAERQRELGILRSIGAERRQLAWMQIITGVIIGGLGAILGVPLGVGIAKLLGWVYREQLTWGVPTPGRTLVLAAIGSVVSGVLGALWPAWRAGRTSPLGAIASRAKGPSRRGVAILTIVGALGLVFQAGLIMSPLDGQVVFWVYATVGLLAMYVGYFLLSVAITLACSRILAPGLSRAMGLPPRLVAQTVAATPYRHGFTAGALMVGLAFLVSLWNNGGAILRDWLGKIEFPDAFVAGPALSEAARQKLDSLDGVVERTCAISLHFVDNDIFGVRGLQRYKSTFLAFEPDPFFRMTRLTWVQGDEATAVLKLNRGGAVLVAREFQVARGLGVGDTLRLSQEGRAHDFEIVGVVTSPGIEIASDYFNIGETYTDQALHAVFGSRRDLKEKFNSDAIQMIQIDLVDGVDDERAVREIRTALAGYGVLDVGSGRRIKNEISWFARRILTVFSTIGVVAMLVASLGVANLIVATVQTRRFEFGVLRAVGAPRGVVAGLVLAEVVIIAVAASVLGTGLGMQDAAAGQRLYADLLGMELRLRPPWRAIGLGSLSLMVIALLAAAPAVVGLNRLKPRELIASMRG
jgi:putative ABC transport system permease protein